MIGCPHLGMFASRVAAQAVTLRSGWFLASAPSIKGGGNFGLVGMDFQDSRIRMSNSSS